MAPNDELIELVRSIEASVRLLCRKARALSATAAAQAQGEEVGNRLLNKQETMDYLGITNSTYYRWIQEGKLRPRGLPGQDYFYESELIFLKSRLQYRERC